MTIRIDKTRKELIFNGGLLTAGVLVAEIVRAIFDNRLEVIFNYDKEKAEFSAEIFHKGRRVKSIKKLGDLEGFAGEVLNALKELAGF
jgi:Mg2+ and Co2+ transporter CorA